MSGTQPRDQATDARSGAGPAGAPKRDTQEFERSWSPKSERIALWTLLGVLLVTLAWVLPRSVQGGDAAEFSTIMLRGGIAHPSGYPWMRMLGPLARLAEALGLPPASAAALIPASFGVAAWCLWLHTLMRWVHPGIAWFWCALVGTSALAVEHLYDAEVWGLHMFFVALFVSLATRSDPPRPLWLGLVLGAATAHHLTAVLIVPLAVAGAWPRDEQPLVSGLLRNGALGVAGAVLGLSVFLTLRIAVDAPGAPGWTWGQFDSWSGWLHHISRGDYGTTELSLHESSASALDQIMRAQQSVAANLSGGLAGITPVAAAALLGTIALVATMRMRSALPLRYSFAYGATLVLTLVFFPSLADLDPTRPHSVWILERFDFLPLAMIMGTAAFACEGMRRNPRQGQSLPQGVVRVGAIVVAATIWLWSMSQSMVHPPALDRGVEAYARAMYASPDPAQGRAIVFGTDDHRSFPAVFVSEVLEPTSEVLYIDPSLMAYPWYRERVWARWPQLPRVEKPIAFILAMHAHPELADTPIFIANYFSQPSHTLPVVPQGVLMRVRSPGMPQPIEAIEVFEAAHLAALERIAAAGIDASHFDAGYAGHAVWSGDLLYSFADRAQEMAQLLERSGRTDAIARLLERMAALATPGTRLLVRPAG